MGIYSIFISCQIKPSNTIISHIQRVVNMVYRTGMQIVADMLYITEQSGQEGIKTTTLLTKANLSHSRLEKFVVSVIHKKLRSIIQVNTLEQID